MLYYVIPNDIREDINKLRTSIDLMAQTISPKEVQEAIYLEESKTNRRK